MAILIFGVSLYAKYLMTGQTPELNINQKNLPNISVSKITNSISNKVTFVKDKVSTTNEKKEAYFYKWRDQKGIIHYTSEKPAIEVEVNKLETIKIDNQTNVVPAVSDNSAEVESIHQQKQQTTSSIPDNPYSSKGIKQLMNQAKDVQNLMNEHIHQQEQIY